ncbi:MAG TPA: NAD(P)H-dependent oxidoreductase, partial [Candidatus Krumholzibacteria bacterium]|nr:NAD(P)H-dependent oxidoreductase [Candidatus Krumholzibacteria bacterium]
IILQHPFFWYSTPAMIKQWEDLVLEHGWAYGAAGTALRGKRMLNLITAGGRDAAYRADGMNRNTFRQFLAPIEQTARLCGMDWAPPWVIPGTHRLGDSDIQLHAVRYRELLTALHDDRLDLGAAAAFDTLNDALPSIRRSGSPI